MEKLEKLVADLTKLNIRNSQIKKLQDIGTYLLTKVIIIGNITVQPLWVEAYYYNEKKNFTDASCHRNEAQKDNFRKLYFHHKTGDRRSGVDICVSNGEFYLSYLLKYTLVNGEFTTQSQLHNKIYDEYIKFNQISFDNDSIDLNKDFLTHIKRIRVTTGEYINEHLASVRDINKKFKNSQGKLVALPKKEECVFEYMKSHPSEDREKQCKELLGSRSTKIIEYFK